MKTIVIYRSKTGYTKKYAEWIAEKLNCDISEIGSLKLNTLNSYDTIIYGGSLYAGGILGVKLITQNLDKFKDKKLVVFAIGLSSSTDALIQELTDRNFSKIQQNYIKFFYLRGGYDHSKLNLFDKFMMKVRVNTIKGKDKESLTEDERGMLSVYGSSVDFSDKSSIEPLINYVNS